MTKTKAVEEVNRLIEEVRAEEQKAQEAIRQADRDLTETEALLSKIVNGLKALLWGVMLG